MSHKTHSSLTLLATLGVLALTLPASNAVVAQTAAVDTSQWKCESCPYPKGTSGAIDVGLGATTDAAARFGDYTGLDRKGAQLLLGGTLSYRGGDGYFADAEASDLGLGSRRLDVLSGREGRYSIRLGYQQIPRSFGDEMRSPFAGIGSGVLTLPAGFPAASTAAMPASAIVAVDPELKWQRFSLAGTLLADGGWSWHLGLRRDARDGTKPITSSFFATATQMLAPLDQVTQELEVGGRYQRGPLQASLSYTVSRFQNDASSLTWANPFFAVVAGATRGQLALAPDNTLHQLSGSAGYDWAPWKARLSGDFAVGRLTQDAAFVNPTTNSLLGAITLPAPSLGGKVETFSGNLRASAAPLDGLRLVASYSRDVRDDRTSVRSGWPTVTTDLYLNPGTTTNTPFDSWRDRLKLSADWRVPAAAELKLKLSGGVDHDVRQRNYAEVVKVRETTVWAGASAQPMEALSLALKLQHAERDNTPYGSAPWFGSAENPLLRKFNLASRTRDGGTLRADFTVSEKVSVGLSAGVHEDDYDETTIGLQSSRSDNVGVDVGIALSDDNQINLYAQSERLRTRQAGSQTFALPEWSALHSDRFELAGVGFRHVITAEKFDVGGDLLFGRSSSTIDITMLPLAEPPFPANKTRMDSVRLWAHYKLDEKMSIKAGWAYEKFRSNDWHVDGILPATVGNLLSLGEPSPRYQVHWVTVALRYRF